MEFARYNDFLLANTIGHHKKFRIWTWNSPGGNHWNQICYILINKRLRSSIKIARTRSFPAADIGSDHSLIMMTFQLHLKKILKPSSTRLRFDLDKLKDPKVTESFKAMVGGKFAPLVFLHKNETDIDSIINAFNTAVTETAEEVLGKKRAIKNP